MRLVSVADREADVFDFFAKAQELGEVVLSARQRAGVLERDFHALEVSRRELEVKRENTEERTLAAYSAAREIDRAEREGKS